MPCATIRQSEAIRNRAFKAKRAAFCAVSNRQPAPCYARHRGELAGSCQQSKATDGSGIHPLPDICRLDSVLIRARMAFNRAVVNSPAPGN